MSHLKYFEKQVKFVLSGCREACIRMCKTMPGSPGNAGSRPARRFLALMLTLFVSLTVIILSTSCEKDFEGVDLPLAVNSTSLELDSAGATHIMVYSTGKWKVAFENPVNWAKLNKTEGTGNSDFVLTYEGAADTARSAVIIISRAADTLTKTVAIHQEPLSAFQN